MNNLIKIIQNIFLWSSGADLEILEQVPSEKSKYYGIGGTIIFTALMASFAGGYALFTAFKSVPMAIFFGIFWGALIYNLDRFIVSTFGVGDGKKTISKQELIEAAPRIVMAITLGIVIAYPLELKLFESEIQAQIDTNIAFAKRQMEAEMTDSTSNHLIIDREGKIDKLTNSIREHEDIVLRATEAFNQADKDKREEWITGERSGKPGKGPVWIELNEVALDKKKNLEETKARYKEIDNKDQDEIYALRSEINNLRSKNLEDFTKSSLVQEANNGLMARLRALDQLTSQDTILKLAKWLITLLFILIEIAPILFKMMTERGPYDDILDRMKHEIKVKELLKTSNLNQEINVLVRSNEDKNKQKLKYEMESNMLLMNEIATAQAEIAAEAIAVWKEEQKKKVRENPSTFIK